MDELRVFVEAGGTLVSIDLSTTAISEDLALPARSALAGLEKTEFYCPGSLLRVVVDNTNPLAYRLPREFAVLLMDSTAFDICAGELTSVAR